MAIKTKFEEQTPSVGTPGLDAAPLSAPSAAISEFSAANGAVLKDTINQTGASVEATRTHMKEGMDNAMKTVEEMMAFGQGNFEALVKSGQIWATGLQDLGKQVAATTQARIESTMSAIKAIAGTRSVKDAFEMQASFARSAIEKTLAESGRLTESSIKLTEQAMAPVTARVSLAVEKFSHPA